MQAFYFCVTIHNLLSIKIGVLKNNNLNNIIKIKIFLLLISSTLIFIDNFLKIFKIDPLVIF